MQGERHGARATGNGYGAGGLAHAAGGGQGRMGMTGDSSEAALRVPRQWANSIKTDTAARP